MKGAREAAETIMAIVNRPDKAIPLGEVMQVFQRILDNAEVLARAVLGGQGDDGDEPVDSAFIASVFGHPIDPVQFATTEEWWRKMVVTVKFHDAGESVTPIRKTRKMSEITRGDFRRLLAALGIA